MSHNQAAAVQTAALNDFNNIFVSIIIPCFYYYLKYASVEFDC